MWLNVFSMCVSMCVSLRSAPWTHYGGGEIQVIDVSTLNIHHSGDELHGREYNSYSTNEKAASRLWITSEDYKSSTDFGSGLKSTFLKVVSFPLSHVFKLIASGASVAIPRVE